MQIRGKMCLRNDMVPILLLYQYEENKGAFTNPPGPYGFAPGGLSWIVGIVRFPFDFHSYGVYGYISKAPRDAR